MRPAARLVPRAPPYRNWSNHRGRGQNPPPRSGPAQPTDAVIILMVMHVAIAVVIYGLLVALAPTRPRAERPAHPAQAAY